MRERSAATLIATLVTGSLCAGAPNPRAEAAEVGVDLPPPTGVSVGLGVDLDTVTIPELQARMADGSLTSKALTTAYLRRIKAVDPKIHAVLRTDPTALRQAAASDVRHRSGDTHGPLDGIPSCSRTTSTPAICPRPPGRWRWPAARRTWRPPW